VLGDHLLTAEEAKALLTSPAAEYFTAEELIEAGAPIVSHTATLEETMPPGGIEFDVQSGTMRPIGGHFGPRIAVHVQPPGVLLSRSWDDMRKEILSQLAVTVALLTESSPWKEYQAEQFVLTGEIPFIPALDVETAWSRNGASSSLG
jgi:hypothetical protein